MRQKRILWIEDDSFAIRGLLRPLEGEGFSIDVAESAVNAFKKAQAWESYDLIIVDLILPISDAVESVPDAVKSWGNEEYVGVGLVKWLLTGMKVKCPVLILSVVRDPVLRFNLQDIGLAGCLAKRGILPSHVKEEVLRLLERDTA